MSIGKKLLAGLTALTAAAMLCFGFTLSASAKNAENFTKIPQYVDGDFVALNTEGNEDGSVLSDGELSFVGIADDCAAILKSKTKLTAPYTVEISSFSNTGGYPIAQFILGSDDCTTGGNEIRNAGGLLFDISAGAILPFGSEAAIYEADGTTPAVGNFFANEIGWLTDDYFTFKFDVQSNGWVNVYYDRTSSGNLSTLRKIVKPADGSDLASTKEGYFAYIPRVTENDKTAGNSRKVQYITLNEDKTVFSTVDSEKWAILGDTSKAVISHAFSMNDNNNATVASKFAFTDEGLANDGVVFDIGFVSSRSHMATSPTWGLAFGMNGVSADIANASRYELSVTEGRVYDGTTAKENGNGASYATNIYNTGGDVTIRLVATKDGKLTEYRGVGGSSIENVYTTYEGLDFNGNIAFYSRKGADTMANDAVTFKNISIKGNADVRILGVELDKGVFAGVKQSSRVTLAASVKSYPQTACDVAYSITSGSELCSLVGNVLDITGNGSITVRATSVDDSSKYDEYTFTVRERVFENYVLSENFEELNEADWTLYDTDENVIINEGLYFSGDNKSEAGGSAALVSNVYFLRNDASDEIFDITFTSGLLSAAKFREASYSWGLMFGMKDKTAKVGDDGVGYIKVDYNNTYVFRGATAIEPEYKTDRTSVAGDVFFETPYDVTIRAVGKADGTLELYRGYGTFESAETLFATYSGLDFNGYVAFTTDSTKDGDGNEKYQVRFGDVVLSGNVEIDNVYEILNVKIDEKAFADAIVSDVPISVLVTVNARPNLAAYRGYTLSIVSGNAEVTDAGLVVKGEGNVTVRAVSVLDETKFAEYTFTATELRITDITVNENLFKDLNSDSQPIQLVAAVQCNLIANKYQAVKWSVVSGNVEIVGDQLRILGAGDVQIKVESLYSDYGKIISFTVADADAGQNTIDDDGKPSGGCGSAAETAGYLAFTVTLLAAGVLITRKP